MSKLEKVGYSRLGGVIGGIYSIKKYVHLYLGAGYGRCGIAYSNEERTLHYQSTPIRGIEAEISIIVKQWKHIGLSVGYDAIANLNMDSKNRFYGDVNFGILIFL